MRQSQDGTGTHPRAGAVRLRVQGWWKTTTVPGASDTPESLSSAGSSSVVAASGVLASAGAWGAAARGAARSTGPASSPNSRKKASPAAQRVQNWSIQAEHCSSAGSSAP